MSARLSGRVAIVTDAGRGLGRGMAFGLACLGATVVGPANITSDFDNLKPTDALPGRTVGLNADLRRSADCGAVISAAQGAGGVHILVSNAGLTLPTGGRRRQSSGKPATRSCRTSWMPTSLAPTFGIAVAPTLLIAFTWETQPGQNLGCKNAMTSR